MVVLWKRVLITVEIIMGMGFSRDRYAFHPMKGVMMLFWNNKNKKKMCVEKEISMVMVKKQEKPWGYVEFFPLTQQLSRLNELAHVIEEISVMNKVSHAEFMNDQLSLKDAYIAEFEQEYQKVFIKPRCYEDYKRTRSTL